MDDDEEDTPASALLGQPGTLSLILESTAYLTDALVACPGDVTDMWEHLSALKGFPMTGYCMTQ